MSGDDGKQLLHFVFGGELKNTGDIEFKDLGKLDFVGMYPNFAEAKKAWRAKGSYCRDCLISGNLPVTARKVPLGKCV